MITQKIAHYIIRFIPGRTFSLSLRFVLSAGGAGAGREYEPTSGVLFIPPTAAIFKT
jgi:hypothetical protein